MKNKKTFNITQVNTPYGGNQYNIPTSISPKKKRKWPIVLIVLFICFIVIGAVGSSSTSEQNKQENKTEEKEVNKDVMANSIDKDKWPNLAKSDLSETDIAEISTLCKNKIKEIKETNEEEVQEIYNAVAEQYKLTNKAVEEAYLYTLEKEGPIYKDAQIVDIKNGYGTKTIGTMSLSSANSDECTDEALTDWYFNYVLKNKDCNFHVIIYKDIPNKGVYANGLE